MPVEKVRNAVGENGTRGARREVGRQTLKVSQDHIVVVHRHSPNIDRRVRAAKLLCGMASSLERFVDDFEEQALLWVYLLNVSSGQKGDWTGGTVPVASASLGLMLKKPASKRRTSCSSM